jgi:hypothetical protein
VELLLLASRYQGYRIEGDEMGRPCNAHVETRNANRSWFQNPKSRPFEKPGVNGRLYQNGF